MEGGIQAFAKKVAAEVAANGEPQEAEGGAPPAERKYRGVSRRRGGKCGADIQEPFTQERVWLGTYDTREEAACAYDAASRTMRPHAKTNFPEPAGEEETRLNVVRAHVDGVKRRREDKMQKKEAEAAAAAARDAAVPPPVQPPPGAAAASDASGSHPAPASPVGVSSIRLFGHVLTPAAPLDFGLPPPPPAASPAPAQAANASASQLPPAVLAPAPLNFAFPNDMAPPPPVHLALAPTAPAAATPQTHQEYVDQCLARARTTAHAHLQALRHLRDVEELYNRALAVLQDVNRRLAEVQAPGGLGAAGSDPGTQE